MKQEEFKLLVAKVAAELAIYSKPVLTAEEAARYLGVKLSYLYKLTMNAAIPHSKPGGKICYFKRDDLDAWLTSNPVACTQQLSDRAMKYCMENRMKVKMNNKRSLKF